MESNIYKIKKEKSNLIFHSSTGKENIHGNDRGNRMSALYRFLKFFKIYFEAFGQSDSKTS